MSDAYAGPRRRVARALKRFSTGAVSLSRSLRGERDPSAPWKPGEAVVDVYDLDAVVSGVTAEHIEDTTVLATDLMVQVSPKARHASHDGVAIAGGVVDLEPRMSDLLSINGGEPKTIKKIKAVPAAGPAAKFLLFVAS